MKKLVALSIVLLGICHEITAATIEQPDKIIVELMFQKTLRKHLNDPDSYKPGVLKFSPHAKGYAYIHEFRAKNAFGGYVKQYAGLLASTNTGEIAWTFYPPDQISQFVTEILVHKKAQELQASEPQIVEQITPAVSPVKLAAAREALADLRDAADFAESDGATPPRPRRFKLFAQPIRSVAKAMAAATSAETRYKNLDGKFRRMSKGNIGRPSADAVASAKAASETAAQNLRDARQKLRDAIRSAADTYDWPTEELAAEAKSIATPRRRR